MRITEAMERIPAILMTMLCALAFAFPAVASAGRVTIPPNQAEADEYTEGVPDGKGDSAPDKTKDPADVLDQGELSELGQLGATGAGVATLAASTAPNEPRAGGPGSSSNSGFGSGTLSAAEVGNPAAAAYVPSDDGMGSWLWIIVAIAAISAAVYALYLWTKGRRA
jgi:hypothetical protein